MKEIYEYKLNHTLIVYSENPKEVEDEIDFSLSAPAEITIVTDNTFDRSDLWDWVQDKFGSFPNETRTDITPSLEEVVNGIFKHMQETYHIEVKVIGKVSDNLGEFTYTKESERKDRIIK